jgi:hypothetical protein
MGLFFTVLYLLYMFASPASWIPELTTAKVEVILAVLAVLATVPRMLNRSLFHRTPQIFIFILFFLLVVASPILGGWFGGVPGAITEQAPYLLVLFLVRLNCDTIGRRRVLLGTFALLLTVIAAVGTYNFSKDPENPDNKFVFDQGVEDQDSDTKIVDYRLKAQGLLDDPNDFAQSMLVSIVLLSALWDTSMARNLFGVIVPSAILFLGIYLTHSRGALVAVAIVLAVAFRRKLKLWGSIAFAALMGLAMFAAKFAGSRSISINSGIDRLDLWSEGLTLLKQSHLLGIGLHNFADEVGMTAHNSLLLVATETGMLGLVLFMSVIVITYYQLNRLRASIISTNAPDTAPVLREIRAYELALTGYLATGWFLSRAFHPMPYLLVGLIASLVGEYSDLNPDWELTPRWPTWLRTSLAASVLSLVLIYVMVRLRAV